MVRRTTAAGRAVAGGIHSVAVIRVHLHLAGHFVPCVSGVAGSSYCVRRMMLCLVGCIVWVHHVPVGHVTVWHGVHFPVGLLDGDGCSRSCGSCIALRLHWHHTSSTSNSWIFIFLEESLGLASGPVFVVWVFLHVHSAKTLGFINKWTLFRFVQQFPFGTETF